jgi:hypothetical protein
MAIGDYYLARFTRQVIKVVKTTHNPMIVEAVIIRTGGGIMPNNDTSYIYHLDGYDKIEEGEATND